MYVLILLEGIWLCNFFLGYFEGIYSKIFIDMSMFIGFFWGRGREWGRVFCFLFVCCVFGFC